MLLGSITNLLEVLCVFVEESRFIEFLLQYIRYSLILILEESTSELFYLTYHIPAPVVGDIVQDITHYPFQDDVVSSEVVYHLIHSHLFYLYIVKTNAQSGGKIQFASQVTEYTLEECVDGHNPELVIVMSEMMQGDARAFTYQLLFQASTLLYLFQVSVRLRQSLPDAI